jgi:hypothetical protein
MPREAAEVLSVLKKRYAPPEWAFIEEVGDATGTRQSRSADAVAMNLWPSRGLEVHGFEVKVRRPDWLSELKDPAKSAAIQRFCDRWWVVTGARDIVRVEELPPTWGLLSAAGGRIVCVKEAPKLEAVPPDRGFVASVLRRSFEVIGSTKESDARYLEGKLAGMEAGKQSAEGHFLALQNQYDRLVESVRRFQETSGLRIDSYNGASLGKAVDLAQQLMRKAVDVGSALQRAKQPLQTALQALEAIEALRRAQGAENVVLSSAP